MSFGLLAGLGAGAVLSLAPAWAGAAWPGPLRLALAAAGLLTLAGVGRQGLRALRAEERAAQAEVARLTQVLGMAVDACIELDPQGRLVCPAPGLGGPDPIARDAQGCAPWAWEGWALAPEAQAALRRHLEIGDAWRDLPLRRIQPGGTWSHWQLSGQPRHDAAGQLLGFSGLLREVSAEVRVLDALRLSEARFHDLFRRLPTAVVVHREGRVLDANPAAVALFGYSDLASMLGQDVTQAYEEGESRERARRRLREHLAQRPGQHLSPTEYRLRPTPGQLLIVQASSAVVDAEDGQPALLTIYIDDTEHRQSEQAMQRSEALLSHLVANSPDLITLTDLSTGRYLMVNPSFVRLSGYSAEEAIGKTSLELNIWANPADREQLVAALAHSDTVQNMAVSFRVRDGRRVSMLMSAARFAMDERQYLILACRDITASEQARLEREAILDNAQLGIALTRNEHFMMVNPRFEQMMGWPAGALIGQHGSVVWPTREAYAEVGQQIGAPLGRGERIEVERQVMRRDGSTFLCRMLAKAVDPTHPSRGGTIWVVDDVTEERQVEQALARARDEAEAASRAKSAFLASTSHEIRTPLNALLGLARLARQPALDEGRRRQYIEQISDSAETLSGILSDILDLSKIEAGKMHVDLIAFDLGALLTSLHQAYGALADTKGLAFHVERDDDLPDAVLGDSVRVRQILSNFLNNALKFTVSGSLLLAARVVRQGLLRFEVTDTGPGIDEATQARLFLPFAQADHAVTRAFGGTGLGLSICRELADLMGGRVGVVSSPGQGSCFWTELPLSPADPDELDSGSTNGNADPIRGARLLMVEDNPVNMMIAVALLEQWGAVVAQAGDGIEALEAVDAAHERGDPFEAVLMDVQMPGMSGHEATRRLRKRYSAGQLPIIALTAAALVSERNEALEAGMNDFLTKPIDSQRLRHALVKALKHHAQD